jgi:hypothetical protein
LLKAASFLQWQGNGSAMGTFSFIKEIASSDGISKNFINNPIPMAFDLRLVRRKYNQLYLQGQKLSGW